MNIRNINKFRDELFAAIKDSTPLLEREPEAYLYVTKPIYEEKTYAATPDEDFSLRADIAVYMHCGDVVGMKAVALPKPLKVAPSFYLVLDNHCDADLYVDRGDYFDFVTYLDHRDYNTKTGFCAAVARCIEREV